MTASADEPPHMIRKAGVYIGQVEKKPNMGFVQAPLTNVPSCISVEIAKSTRHSKITGDFAEALTLYWLSRDAFECASVDHTGIDLIARNRRTKELMGVSVKSRSRYRGTERDSVSIVKQDLKKVAAACKAFACNPYFSIVVDCGDQISLFLTSMSHLRSVAKPGKGKIHWGMTETHLNRYRRDDKIQFVEFVVSTPRWWK